MKNRILNSVFLGYAAMFIFAGPLSATEGRAAEVNVTPAMQACASDADCTVADGQCGNSCSSVPINAQSTSVFEQQKVAMCGQPTGAEPGCTTVPALVPSCIHNRCTIGNAYEEHADAKDYGSEKALRKSALNYRAIPKPNDTKQNDVRPEDIAPAAGGDENTVQPQYSAHSRGFSAYDLPDQGKGTMQVLGTMP